MMKLIHLIAVRPIYDSHQDRPKDSTHKTEMAMASIKTSLLNNFNILTIGKSLMQMHQTDVISKDV